MSDTDENIKALKNVPHYKVFIPNLNKWAHIMVIDYHTQLVELDIENDEDMRFKKYQFKDVLFVQSTGIHDTTPEMNLIFEHDVLELKDQRGKTYYSEVRRQGSTLCICTQDRGCFELGAIDFVVENDVSYYRRIASALDKPDLLNQLNSGMPSE